MRILVVDDNRDTCAFMRAAQRSAPAELLITDIFMPGQEGFETIRRFKAEFPQTRIIVMSAGTVPGMKHDFLASAALLGVAAALRKPFTADQLVEIVRRVLQQPR